MNAYFRALSLAHTDPWGETAHTCTVQLSLILWGPEQNERQSYAKTSTNANIKNVIHTSLC